MSTQLDFGQVIKNSYDEASQSLKVTPVDSTAGMTVISNTVTAYSSINGSGGAITQIVASTSGNISKLIPQEQTGVAINLYTGPANSEVLLMTIAPGQDTPVEMQIPVGTRLSIRAYGASAPTAGSVYLTFIG